MARVPDQSYSNATAFLEMNGKCHREQERSEPKKLVIEFVETNVDTVKKVLIRPSSLPTNTHQSVSLESCHHLIGVFSLTGFYTTPGMSTLPIM